VKGLISRELEAYRIYSDAAESGKGTTKWALGPTDCAGVGLDQAFESGRAGGPRIDLGNGY